MAKRRRANQVDPNQHVTQPDDQELIYHRGLHRAGEGVLCHYLGLTDKGALRRLRLCHVVVRAWTYLKPMLFHEEYSKVDDIHKVFDLFNKEETEDEFESSLGIDFSWESHCQVFMPNGTLVMDDSEEVRVKHLASVLVTLKHSLANSLDVLDGLEDLSAKARNVFESYSRDRRDEFNVEAYQVPVIPYTSDEKICLLALDCNEHRFEHYQRLYILLRHADMMLSASKWTASTYDMKKGCFRSNKWAKPQNGVPKSFQIKPEDMPRWMRPKAQPVQDLEALLAAQKASNSYKLVWLRDLRRHNDFGEHVSNHLENLGREFPQDLDLKVNPLVVPSSEMLHDYLCRELQFVELGLKMVWIILFDVQLEYGDEISEDVWRRRMTVWSRVGGPKDWDDIQESITKSECKAYTLFYIPKVNRNIFDEEDYPWETEERGVLPADYFRVGGDKAMEN